MNIFKTTINEQQQQKHLLPQQHVLIKSSPMFLQTLNNSFTETKQLEQQDGLNIQNCLMNVRG
uniref:Uncharacterized protein n=1 Tax=Meloidogyne enterolobii TaxID=390850 RepID=A0A6V7YCG5_MELEN|nr:unnamed protein product [Meloidogyne enterolobii]